MKIANFFGLILFCFFFGMFGSLHGQPYYHYGFKEGLATNYAYRIIQDNRRFVWIATANGISCLDRKEFKNFNLQNGLTTTYIWMLLPDNSR